MFTKLINSFFVASAPMNPVKKKIEKASPKDWELDMFSTFLSRKHAYHKVIGPVRYVRVRHVSV